MTMKIHIVMIANLIKNSYDYNCEKKSQAGRDII